MPWLGGSPNLPPTISISNNIINFQFVDDNLRYVTVYENGNLVDRIGDIHAPYTIPEHLRKKNVSNLLRLQNFFIQIKNVLMRLIDCLVGRVLSRSLIFPFSSVSELLMRTVWNLLADTFVIWVWLLMTRKNVVTSNVLSRPIISEVFESFNQISKWH